MPPSASLELQTLSLADRKHVLIVAIGLLGHLVPSIELGVQLVRVHGCRVSLVVSKIAVAIAHQCQLVPSQYAHLLVLVPMADGVEASKKPEFDMQELLQMLKQANAHFDKLARLIRTRNNLPGDRASQSDVDTCPLPDQHVDHIIVEWFTAFAIEHVRDLGLPVTGLWTNSLSMSANRLARRDKAAATLKEPPPSNAERDITAEAKPTTAQAAWPAKPIIRMSNLIWSCERVLINTFDGLENAVLTKLRALSILRNTRLYTIGPLSLYGNEPISTSALPGVTRQEQYATTWLDKQRAAGRPVVYISYGSLAHLVAEQVSEIAQALDKLKDHASFVWAMRSTQQAALPANILDSVDIYNTPDTHTPRSAASVLVMGWAPQVTILSHPATAAFVSHCGWNSVVEAMSNGVPVVGWPLFADQHKNAEMVASAEVQMGVTIPGTSMTASGRIVCCDEVVAAIRQVLGDGKEPSVYARNAARLGQLARDAVKPDTGSSMRNLRSFIVDASQE
ncbi:UDP-glycosyltransferase-like protein [Sorochytrium milnesiophthora]